jgi:hypothetical protein
VGPGPGAGQGRWAVLLGNVSIDAVAANGVPWATRSMFVASLSHFPKLEAKLELLGSGSNTDLMEGQVDVL